MSSGLVLLLFGGLGGWVGVSCALFGWFFQDISLFLGKVIKVKREREACFFLAYILK